MRTPNTNCDVCNAELYRRPGDQAKFNSVCCRGCRSELYKNREPSPNLLLGRVKGNNHLTGIPKTELHRNKMKKIMSEWCSNNTDKVAERAKKTRMENHYLWNGGSTILNQKIRRMINMRNWQKSVKKRDGYVCLCGSTENLEADHIVELRTLLVEHNIKSTEEARACVELWDISNGQTLCRKCHYAKDGRQFRKVTA